MLIMTVAYQGVPGAFGHAACLQFVPDHEPIAKPSFVSVLAAVASGESEYGVLPVENSAAGRFTTRRTCCRGAVSPS
jgi:prephenate dehydratase